MLLARTTLGGAARLALFRTTRILGKRKVQQPQFNLDGEDEHEFYSSRPARATPPQHG